jgi:hypothetical protein
MRAPRQGTQRPSPTTPVRCATAQRCRISGSGGSGAAQAAVATVAVPAAATAAAVATSAAWRWRAEPSCSVAGADAMRWPSSGQSTHTNVRGLANSVHCHRQTQCFEVVASLGAHRNHRSNQHDVYSLCSRYTGYGYLSAIELHVHCPHRYICTSMVVDELCREVTVPWERNGVNCVVGGCIGKGGHQLTLTDGHPARSVNHAHVYR